MTDNLTIADALALAAVIEAGIHNHLVARFVPKSGDVAVGTAHPVVVDDAADVRDGWLPVTLLSGIGTLWPVRELMAEVKTNYFNTEWDCDSP